MDERIEVLKGLKKPHGLIFNGQYLYVTESNKVSRYQYDPYSFEVGTKENIIEFPDDGGNLPRTLKIKDNKLLFTEDKTGTKITGILGLRTGLEKEYFKTLNFKDIEEEEGFKIFIFHK